MGAEVLDVATDLGDGITELGRGGAALCHTSVHLLHDGTSLKKVRLRLLNTCVECSESVVQVVDSSGYTSVSMDTNTRLIPC